MRFQILIINLRRIGSQLYLALQLNFTSPLKEFSDCLVNCVRLEQA